MAKEKWLTNKKKSNASYVCVALSSVPRIYNMYHVHYRPCTLPLLIPIIINYAGVGNPFLHVNVPTRELKLLQGISYRLSLR